MRTAAGCEMPASSVASCQPRAVARVGKVDVGGFARGSDGRTVQRAAITWDEVGRFVAEEFGKHLAGVFHRGAERAGDAQEAQFGDRTHSERTPRPPCVHAGMVLVALHEVGDKGGNIEKPDHGNSSRMASTSA